MLQDVVYQLDGRPHHPRDPWDQQMDVRENVRDLSLTFLSTACRFPVYSRKRAGRNSLLRLPLSYGIAEEGLEPPTRGL